jgi:proteasome lid subunit RPN8/RPN11
MALNDLVLDFLEGDQPWTSLDAHAMAAFPAESCALAFAGTATGFELVLTENVAACRETAFAIAPNDLLGPLATGLELAAIIHSHCRIGCRLSDADICLALGPEGEPLFPGVTYVVLDAQEDGLRGYAAYLWRDGAFERIRRVRRGGMPA